MKKPNWPVDSTTMYENFESGRKKMGQKDKLMEYRYAAPRFDEGSAKISLNDLKSWNYEIDFLSPPPRVEISD